MTIDRRQLLRGIGSAAALGPAALALGGCRQSDPPVQPVEVAAPSQRPGAPAQVLATAEDLQRFFEARGFQTLPAELDLIVESEFNGGLRYDEISGETVAGDWTRLVSCSRMEDLDRLSEPGVLTHFHVLGCQKESPSRPGELLEQCLTFCLEEQQLDPARLALVGAEWLRPHAGLFERFGIGEAQLVFRSAEDVLESGDGSGFFRPEGHPASPATVTVSIHHSIDASASAANLTYPLEGFLEIADIDMNIGPDEGRGREGGAIGIERLGMAIADEIQSHDESHGRLLDRLRMESEDRQLELPEAFESLVQVG